MIGCDLLYHTYRFFKFGVLPYYTHNIQDDYGRLVILDQLTGVHQQEAIADTEKGNIDTLCIHYILFVYQYAHRYVAVTGNAFNAFTQYRLTKKAFLAGKRIVQAFGIDDFCGDAQYTSQQSTVEYGAAG